MSRMGLRTITNWLEAWSAERRLALRTALAGLITFIVGQHLSSAAAALSRRRPPSSLSSVDAARVAFRHALAGLRQSGALREVDIDGVERIFSLAFALQQLRAKLDDLADRRAEHASGTRHGASPSPPA